MKIAALIEKLKHIQKEEGNIEVTCTHSLITAKPEDIFETTVENLEVHMHPTIGKCVRVWL